MVFVISIRIKNNAVKLDKKYTNVIYRIASPVRGYQVCYQDTPPVGLLSIDYQVLCVYKTEALCANIVYYYF